MTKIARTRLVEERKRRHWSQKELASLIGTTSNNISRWELGQTTPGPYYRTKLCELFGIRSQELELFDVQIVERTQQPQSPLMGNFSEMPAFSADQHAPFWNVPYPRNPFFTGREEILDFLYEKLTQEHAMAFTQSWAISGLGGIGKTQIALEYTYRYASAYTAIFWINAESYETLLSSFVSIAGVLNLSAWNESAQSKIVQAVTRWLSEQKSWLLIFDNIEDLALLTSFFPASREGTLLLTTRLQALGTFAQQIDIEPMNGEEGIAFLLQRAKLMQPSTSLEQLSPTDMRAAQTIVKEMDGLPLALDQVGVYIEETKSSLEDYLYWYRQRRSVLLGRRGSSSQDHSASVKTTLSVSFQQVEQQISVAADVLRLCAFLAPNAIPEEVIIVGFFQSSKHLQTLATTPWLLDEVIAVLGTYSLVHRDMATKTLSLHRLVQVVLQEGLSQQEQEAWIKQAIIAIYRVFPEVEYETWSQCEQLISHALQCIQYTVSWSWEQTDLFLASLLFKTARYLSDRTQYTEAEPLYHRTLCIRERLLGSDHPDIAATLHSLALLYKEQGKYAQAEPVYLRAIAMREQALGSEHPQVAISLNGLANLYSEQGKWAEAEVLYLRALSIRERALGPEHPHITDSLCDIAKFRCAQRKMEDAAFLYQRALTMCERSLGAEHWKTLEVRTQYLRLQQMMSLEENVVPIEMA